MRASMIYRYQSNSFKKESDSDLKNFPAFLHVLIPEGGDTTASGSSASAAAAGGTAAAAAAVDKPMQIAKLVKIDEQTNTLMERLLEMSKRLDDYEKWRQ